MSIKKLGSALDTLRSAAKQAGQEARSAGEKAKEVAGEAKAAVTRAAEDVVSAAVRQRDSFEADHPEARTARLTAARHLDGLKEMAASGFERAKTVATTSEAWGTSIGVDDNPTRPYRFGYGEKKNTLAEKQWIEKETTSDRRESIGRPGTFDEVSRTTREAGLKLRAFGGASQETFSGSLGAEAEAGLKHIQEDFHTGTKTESFVGARGRAFVEGGPLGGTAASELFVGGEVFRQAGTPQGGSEPWAVERQQASAGLRVVNKVHGDVFGASVRLQGELGARYRWEFQQHQPVVGGVGVLSTTAFDLSAGVIGDIRAKVGPKGVGAAVEGFVGARMGIEERVAVAYEGSELVGARLRGEGWVGAGFKAEAEVGPDWDSKSVAFKASIGAALIAGGSVSVDATFDGSDLFGKGLDSREPAKETLPLLPGKKSDD